MCDWGGGPYGMTGYKPPDRGHHESDREFAERTEVPIKQPPPERRVTPKFCYHCGGSLEAKHDFCPECGTAVDR